MALFARMGSVSGLQRAVGGMPRFVGATATREIEAAEAVGGRETPFVGGGTGREGEFDPTRAPDRAAGRFGELGVGKTDAPDSADENISEGRATA